MHAQSLQNAITRPELIARRNELLQRLNDGDERISLAKRNGADTAQWENYWISLLRDYELVCTELVSLDSTPLAEAA